MSASILQKSSVSVSVDQFQFTKHKILSSTVLVFVRQINDLGSMGSFHALFFVYGLLLLKAFLAVAVAALVAAFCTCWLVMNPVLNSA